MLDFESCFKELYPSLCSFAFQYLKDRNLSEDVVQEAFVKLWDKYSQFDQFYKVKAFLYITVRNGSINQLNSIKVVDKYYNTTKDNPIEKDADFEMQIIENEVNMLLYKAIETLPSQTQKIIKLSIENKKNQEIADQLNISIDTVKTLKKRAYKALREELSDHYLTIILLLSLINSYFLIFIVTPFY